MKVLVTGASGLLGHDVWRLLEKEHEVMGIGRQRPAWADAPRWRECDLTNAALTYAAVTKENPEVVIHCAAYNNVDGAEKDSAMAYQVNAMAARNLALACQRFDATLLSVSTDYVFDGHNPPSDGYREFDPANPISVYGQSKRWGEMYVQQLLTKYFIVRTSWLFGPSRPTWVDKIVDLASENQPVQAVKDMVSAPTYTPDLAEAIVRLAQSRHYGIYHLTNAGFCSRVELAQEVLRIHKRGDYKHLNIMTLAQLKLPAARPAFSGMQNLAWTLDGFPPLRSWRDALREHFSKSRVPS